MLSGKEAGGPAGSRGCWLTAAGSGIGNPDKVGTGAAGNWFNISGLTAGIPLCKGRKRKDNHMGHVSKKAYCTHSHFELLLLKLRKSKVPFQLQFHLLKQTKKSDQDPILKE